MGFDSSVIGIWRLNNRLIDSVSTRDLVAQVAGNVNFQQFQKFDLFLGRDATRKGLLFESGQSYSADGDFSFTDMTITFWWFSPRAIGYTRHAITRELQTKFAPIVCKADVGSGDPVGFSGGTFFISEIAASDTENAIRVHLCDSSSGGSTVTHVYTSEAYQPGLRHVMITFLRSELLFRIDIDGKPGALFTAPSNVFNGSGDMRINSFVPERTAHTTTQPGYLFDLVISSLGSTNNEAILMMRYGLEYITRSDLVGVRFLDFAFETLQPSTVSTLQILAEGGTVLVSRSDGKLLRGINPIWDREFLYINPREVARINTSPTDPLEMDEPEDGSKRIAEWTTSGLRLKGVKVRI